MVSQSVRVVVYILALYSVCQVIEGRFLWDLSSYCINYCSRMGIQMQPIGVCSCHRITSYHRRTAALRDLLKARKPSSDSGGNDDESISK